MDSDIQQRFEGLERQIQDLKTDVEGLKGDVQTLKSDVQTLKSDVQTLKSDVQTLKSDVQTLKGDVQQIQPQMRQMEDRLSEQMRDMQTELLKAFLPWQQQVRIEFRELEANTGNSVTAIKQRLEVVENRLWEIEKRLLMNPPAA